MGPVQLSGFLWSWTLTLKEYFLYSSLHMDKMLLNQFVELTVLQSLQILDSSSDLNFCENAWNTNIFFTQLSLKQRQKSVI